MDAIEAILTRRSIRNYRKKEVHPEAIRELLRAAMYAPSAADERPWYFVVLNDPSLLEKIPSIHPYAGMVSQAPVAVLVCGDPGREQHAGMWVQDCAAATQNLLLAAHAVGLGSVWVGVYPREERMEPLRKLLGIPAQIAPFALLPLGYPEGAAEIGEDRFSEDRVRTNHW
jgi:nitroreductase